MPAGLWLSLWLPDLPVEVLGGDGDPGASLVVVAGQGGRSRVFAGNGSARALGIHPGMGLDGAWALTSRLRVCRRDPGTEAAALEGLAAWAGQFTSLVSIVPMAGLLLEIGGSLGMFGGLDKLLDRIRRGIAALGYTAEWAVAPTPYGAWLLARAGIPSVVTGRDGLPASLAAVPLACMDLPAEITAALEAVGMKCFGDCCRLPRAELARRTPLPGGDTVVDRLDRALGRIPDPRAAYVAPSVFDRGVVLSHEVTEVAALLFAVHRLLLELAGFLASRSAGVQGLELELSHPGGPVTPVRLELIACSRDPEHLLHLFRDRLEALELPAAVERVGLAASDIHPLAPRNLDLFDPVGSTGGDWPAVVERLCARLGAEAVHGLTLVPEHRPERSWTASKGTDLLKGDVLKGTGEINRDVPVNTPRPVWLLEQPRALEVIGGGPFLGGELRLRSGPERIESGWWDGADATRDYFLAENPRGETFWIFRERKSANGWFLHGVFA